MLVRAYDLLLGPAMRAPLRQRRPLRSWLLGPQALRREASGGIHSRGASRKTPARVSAKVLNNKLLATFDNF